MGSKSKDPQSRPWIGVMFECCSVYSRIYRAPTSTAYRGRCPKCLRTLHLPVGEGGTDIRQIRAR